MACATDDPPPIGDKGGVTQGEVKGNAVMIRRRSTASSAALMQVLVALLALGSVAAGSTAAIASGWNEAGIRAD
ncbi:hypothetical protein [Sphingosinicella sp. CPCC 101087]|uniref:hypothetical protein n=1 Tax=Sphingosinicella sp. CPCC 101087 TaxID=2497754 RepID=UPI00197DE2C7|nr:hypothetical protein [Sphingosinicella sp. CPCC 101087]